MKIFVLKLVIICHCC